VIGDARYSSAELGSQLWDASVTMLATTLETLAVAPID
jgi:hypothetical protein